MTETKNEATGDYTIRGENGRTVVVAHYRAAYNDVHAETALRDGNGWSGHTTRLRPVTAYSLQMAREQVSRMLVGSPELSRDEIRAMVQADPATLARLSA